MVKDIALNAFAAVALDHPCGIFCLQALYFLALESGIGVGAASGANAGDRDGAVGSVIVVIGGEGGSGGGQLAGGLDDVYHSDALPHEAEQHCAVGIGNRIVKQHFFSVLQAVFNDTV